MQHALWLAARLAIHGAQIEMRLAETHSRPLVSTEFQPAACQFGRCEQLVYKDKGKGKVVPYSSEEFSFLS